jgi:hypothetical protein
MALFSSLLLNVAYWNGGDPIYYFVGMPMNIAVLFYWRWEEKRRPRPYVMFSYRITKGVRKEQRFHYTFMWQCRLHAWLLLRHLNHSIHIYRDSNHAKQP